MFFTTNAYAGDTIAVSESQAMPKAPAESSTQFLSSMLPMVAIFAVMYFLIIRPNSKRQKAQEQLVSSVKKGEEVITNSGLFGVVTNINDNTGTIEVEVAKGVNIKMLKTAVANITSRKQEASAPVIAKAKKNKK